MSESNIITGQYVQIDQTPAGIGDRIVAWLIDYAIIIIYLYGTYEFLSRYNVIINTPSLFNFLFVLAIYLPIMFYPMLWETLNNGQSPGKRIRKIKVVNKDGSTPTLGSFFMRWLLLMIDMAGGIGVMTILITKNKQRLGDLAAGTMVIKLDNYHKIQVSLDEFSFASPNYKPVYKQAENLSVRQVEVIEKALSAFDNEERDQRIDTLYKKIHEMLDIPYDNTPHEKFLYTIIRDYQHFALEEV